MKKNKILWISILLIFIIVVLVLVFTLKPKDNNTNSSGIEKGANQIVNQVTDESTTNNKKEMIKTTLSDGTLYSFSSDSITPDIVVGDNYFDTQINDMMLNYNSFKGKKIEVEGMFLQNSPYTFVGRYSTSNLCSYCPVGYSYIEYVLNGSIDTKLVEENSWIKVIGTLDVGNDESSNFQDYYYLNVLSLEVMNAKGQDTVSN